MFRVTRYPMISKTESGRVGYRKKYRVAGRVRVPAGHWLKLIEVSFVQRLNRWFYYWWVEFGEEQMLFFPLMTDGGIYFQYILAEITFQAFFGIIAHEHGAVPIRQLC